MIFIIELYFLLIKNFLLMMEYFPTRVSKRRIFVKIPPSNQLVWDYNLYLLLSWDIFLNLNSLYLIYFINFFIFKFNIT